MIAAHHVLKLSERWTVVARQEVWRVNTSPIDGEEILILRVAMTENTDVRFVTATFSSLLDAMGSTLVNARYLNITSTVLSKQYLRATYKQMLSYFTIFHMKSATKDKCSWKCFPNSIHTIWIWEEKVLPDFKCKKRLRTNHPPCTFLLISDNAPLRVGRNA